MTEAREVSEKLCKDCGLIRPASEFSKDKSKSTGLATYCKDCQKVRKRNHYWSDPDRSRASSNNWYYSNKERALKSCREWDKANREKINESKRRRYRDRIENDVNFKLDFSMRAALQRLIRKGGRSTKVPYSADMLRQRLECQFKPGMSWDNYGEWEIDHKIPMSLMMERGEFRPHIINALSNFQPLWKEENRSKGARYVG